MVIPFVSDNPACPAGVGLGDGPEAPKRDLSGYPLRPTGQDGAPRSVSASPVQQPQVRRCTTIVLQNRPFSEWRFYLDLGGGKTGFSYLLACACAGRRSCHPPQPCSSDNRHDGLLLSPIHHYEQIFQVSGLYPVRLCGPVPVSALDCKGGIFVRDMCITDEKLIIDARDLHRADLALYPFCIADP